LATITKIKNHSSGASKSTLANGSNSTFKAQRNIRKTG
jgi:hypothetical protein